MELYGVDRVTIEDWRRNRGLKMIEVSTHSKYITEKDLLEWENSLKGFNKCNNTVDTNFKNQNHHKMKSKDILNKSEEIKKTISHLSQK